MFRFLLGLILGVVLAVAVPIALVGAGLVDMSASEGPGKVERLVSDWAVDQWRRTHASDDLVDLSAPTTESWEAGLAAYEQSCVVCHGAPEVEAAPWAAHMVPRPTDLRHVGQQLTQSELFLAIQRGERLTGMPAFGDVLSEEEIWDVVRFVRDIEHLTPEQQERLRTAVGVERSEPELGT